LNKHGDEPTDNNEAEVTDEELGLFLDNVDFLEADLHIDASQFRRQEGASDDFEDEGQYQPVDVFALENPGEDVNVGIYIPLIEANANTYQDFCRKMQDTPWIPFAHPKDASSFTGLDIAEHELFDSLSPAYDRNLKKLDATKGYKTFAKVWDLHVANRLKEQLSGLEAEVQTINRKSYLQLQNHYDNKEKHKELLQMNRDTDPAMLRLGEVFKHTRRLLAPHQSVH